MFKYYCAVDDAITYFTTRINKLDDIGVYAERVYKKHPALEKQFKRVLRPGIELQKILDDALPRTMPDEEFFFKLDNTYNGERHRIINPAWMLFGSYSQFDEKPDLGILINHLRRMPQHERDILFVNYLYDLEVPEATQELYNDITEDNCGNLFSVIRDCQLDASTRGRLIDIYANFDEYIDRIEAMLKPAVDLIVKNESVYADNVARIEACIDECGGVCGYMQQIHNYKMRDTGKHRVHLCVLIPFAVSIRNGIVANLDTYIGVGINEIVLLRNSDEENKKISNLFKMLSDETRLDILKTICKRPMYGLEIAEAFDISAPTVSYHMRKLYFGNFAESYFEEGRNYYRANKDGIRYFIKEIEKYLLDDDD